MSNIIPLDFKKIAEEKESEISLSKDDAMQKLKERILMRKEAMKILNSEKDNEDDGYGL